jgi:hypothetical protein
LGDASDISGFGSFWSGGRSVDCAQQVVAKTAVENCLAEDDGAVAVEQDAVLGEPKNGLSQSF